MTRFDPFVAILFPCYTHLPMLYLAHTQLTPLTLTASIWPMNELGMQPKSQRNRLLGDAVSP